MLRELSQVECLDVSAAGVTTSETVYPTLYAGKEIIGWTQNISYDTVTWSEPGLFNTYVYSSQIPSINITPIYAPITSASF